MNATDALSMMQVRSAARLVVTTQKAAPKHLKERLVVSLPVAGRLLAALEEGGIVSAADRTGKRAVLVDAVPDAFLKQWDLPQPETAAPATPSSAEEAQTNAAGAELRQFIERIEHLEAEKKGIAEQIREVFAESKGRGYDNAVMREVLKLRKRDADDIAEHEAVLDMYKAALGMS